MNVKNLMRENILKLNPYTSARDSYESGILLDANENSFGSTAEYKGLELNRYPDPKHKDLRSALSDFLTLPAENIFCGVGSDEIIDLAIRIFCKPGKDKIVIAEPTYGMYKVAADINDVGTLNVPLNDNFQIDMEAVKKTCVEESAKILFLCSPNNPTGNLLNKHEILQLSNELDLIVFVDEAYIDFAEEGSVIQSVTTNPNLIVSRTFSKAWGLAGIRLGYCSANEDIVNVMMNVKAPYNINSATQKIGLAALSHLDKRNELIKNILIEKKLVELSLNKIEAIQRVFKSDGNFILFKINNAKEIQQKLADKGVIIRDRSSQLNLENCLRVTVGTRAENEMFINELEKLS